MSRSILWLASALALSALLGCNGSSVVGGAQDAAVADIGVDSGAACPSPLASCVGRCVDPSADRANCGGCGIACAAGQVCQTGACVPDCARTERLCAGGGDGGAGLRCVATQTDRANCGACGMACGTDQVCSNGVCTFMCTGTSTECSGAAGDAGSPRYCADLQSDRANCGACGAACQEGFGCFEGRCRVSCAELRVRCPAGDAGTETCVDTSNDVRHCGGCGNTCAVGQFCVRGACQTMCGAGFTECSGICRDLRNDREGCGACGTTCASGEVCVAGACQVSCVAALNNCSGSCRDLQTDVTNCGACGTNCPAGQVCSAGRCQVSCGPGLSNCSGSCRDLQTDRANCGACGTACAEGLVCSAGTCQLSCVAGLSSCSGSCRDLQTDRANCGACGTACPSGQVCSAGACQLSCVAGLSSCSGSCRDLQTDRAHCGACGAACGAGQVCAGGVCAASCGPAQTVCSGTCTNTQFDPDNCGGCGSACGPYDNAAASCNGGRCVQTCSPGFADCNADRTDGCERNLNTDLNHCARCGAACPSRANATISCTGGVCGFACAPNFADCDGNPNNGCEADLRVTVAHCGRCGNACVTANGTPGCSAGACTVASCMAPFRDCDSNPSNGCENDIRNTCGGCDLECRDRTVGVGGAPFDGAGQRGTASSPATGLIVSGMSTTTNLDFLWVVNTGESTIGKWDAAGQREVARYRVGLSSGECRGLCCYNNGCNMPSRVVVDGNGDAYVASRGFATQGSVTKLAAERVNCIDRNGNGMIDTSSGPTDVRPYGQDECVLWTTNVGPSNAVLRSIATDRGDTANPFGYIWVGGYNTRAAYRLNPRTGATLGTYPLSVNPYAMVVTRDGRLWVGTLENGALQSVDTIGLTVGPVVPYPLARRISSCAGAYGMTSDGRGRVWLAGWSCRDAIAYDPALNSWTRVDTTGYVTGTGTSGRGITIGADGRVWMTYATPGDSLSGGLLYWDSNAFVAGGTIPGSAITRVPMPGNFNGPSAVGVDRVGNVWLAHYLAPSALIRYSPETNSSVVLFGANQVYSYSDFTGSVRRVSIAQGTYEETIDLGCDAPLLTTFTWNSTTPAGTTISFAARSASTTGALGAATPVTLALAPRDTSPTNAAAAFVAAGVAPARHFRLTISMQAAESGGTPVLQSFNLGWRCPR